MKLSNHPRLPEARGQLGRLQIFRAQMMAVEDDPASKTKARESYLAASKTFDAITADLKVKLEGIDTKKEPKKATLRKTYYGEYLDSQVKAAETIISAAKTYPAPGKGGKKLLDDAMKRFNTIGEKYRKFVPGVTSLVYKGEISELLGQKDKARDFYKQMLDELDADPFREPKQKAMVGMIGLNMSDKPPKFEQSIKLAEPFVNKLRPNERRTPVVQSLRLALAKAYLAKAAAGKGPDAKKATSAGRSLLNDAVKITGPHLAEAKELLEGLGVSTKAEPLPTAAEPPKSLDDALTSATTLYQATATLQQSLDTLAGQKETPEIEKEMENLSKQLAESRSISIQIMRHGLGMVNSKTNTQTINQVRQLLAISLLNSKKHHDALVVGTFLSRSAPGTEMGLNGSRIALSAFNTLLKETDIENNDGLMQLLANFSEHLAKTWPDDPVTSKAQGERIYMMLRKDNYKGAQGLIGGMKNANEQAVFRRLLGQMLWNRSLELRREENIAQADAVQKMPPKLCRPGWTEFKESLVAK